MLKRYFIRFKSKWNIQSNWQLFKVMVVFSMAGQSILFAMPFVKDYFELPDDLNFLWKALFFIFISFPIYQVFLLFWALLLGEFQFFLFFIKTSFKKSKELFKVRIKK